MSRSKMVWVPAVLAILLAFASLIYSFSIGHIRTEPNRTAELFKNIGTAAVFCGAASFLWLRFKLKRKSESSAVKQLAAWVYAIHQLAGYAAFVVILVHGIYFLFYAKLKSDTFTGLAAFAIVAAITGYGMLLKRVRNVWMRVIHRALAIAWIPLLLLHAGGSAITAAAISVAVWGLVWYLERHGRSRKLV